MPKDVKKFSIQHNTISARFCIKTNFFLYLVKPSTQVEGFGDFVPELIKKLLLMSVGQYFFLKQFFSLVSTLIFFYTPHFYDKDKTKRRLRCSAIFYIPFSNSTLEFFSFLSSNPMLENHPRYFSPQVSQICLVSFQKRGSWSLLHKGTKKHEHQGVPKCNFFS